MKMDTEKEMSDLRMMYLEMESSTFFRSELFDVDGELHVSGHSCEKALLRQT